MKFHVIIPARYGSFRLPGKVLMDIAGKPMLQRVYENAVQSGAHQVVIATDDDRVRTVAESLGAQVCMTGTHHTCGTERVAEVVTQLNYADSSIIVNLQGDEPLMPPNNLRRVAEILMTHPILDIGTLCVPIHTHEDLHNTNIVKVVRDRESCALYFSRSVIPHDRDNLLRDKVVQAFPGFDYYRHLGLYAYRAHALKQYSAWSICPIEQLEALEQLRFLWHGKKIHVALTDESSPMEVNTPSDLERVRVYLKSLL